MDYSMPGFPIHHQLLKLAQTHAHRVGDATQPSHPLSSPSPPAFSLSRVRVFSNESVFASCGQRIGVLASASVLPMNIRDLFPLGLSVLILLSKGLSRVFSNTTIQKHQFMLDLSSLTRDQAFALYSGSSEPQPLDYQGRSLIIFLKKKKKNFIFLSCIYFLSLWSCVFFFLNKSLCLFLVFYFLFLMYYSCFFLNFWSFVLEISFKCLIII